MQFSVRRLAPGELDHELIWLSASVLSLGFAAAWLTLGLPWPHCVFHALTNLPCVTCGMTRCGIQFFHGHFLAALQWSRAHPTYLCSNIGIHAGQVFRADEHIAPADIQIVFEQESDGLRAEGFLERPSVSPDSFARIAD